MGVPFTGVPLMDILQQLRHCSNSLRGSRSRTHRKVSHSTTMAMLEVNGSAAKLGVNKTRFVWPTDAFASYM